MLFRSEKKVTEKGKDEVEEDPDLFDASAQQNIAQRIENSLHEMLTKKNASTALRWIVTVGYEYNLRFKPTKDDRVAHIKCEFLTIAIVMVKGAHEIKK